VENINMISKFFIASLAVLARADPEADPALLYGGLGYAGLTYTGLPVAPLAAAHAVPHVPVVKGVVETPAEVATEVKAHAVPVAIGYHGLGYGHYLGKRSADADPAVLAGSTKILTPPTPLIHNPPVRPILAAPAIAHAPLAYGIGYGLGLPAVHHVVAKREAEADPQLIAGLPYAATLPYAGLPLAAAGAVPHVPTVKSVVETPAEVATEVKAHAVPVAVGYHGLGYGLPYYG